MKKIYSLLLLGAFMLLGAQSAWGTDYYYRGSDNSWGTGIKMTDEGLGVYSYKLVSAGAGNHHFKLYDGPNDGATEVAVKGDEIASWSEIDGSFWTEGGGNISFYLASATDIYIYYYSVMDKLIVRKSANKTVTLKSKGLDDPYLFSWTPDHLLHFSGEYTSSKQGVVDGDYYKFVLSVPSSAVLKAAFKSDNNDPPAYKTVDINVGQITSNKTFTYNFNASYGIDAHLVGDFNGWYFDDAFVDGEFTVSLAAHTNYDFQVVTGTTWCGVGGFITNAVTGYELNSGSGHCTLHTGSEGDYTFTITSTSASKVDVTITYPTSKVVKFEKSNEWGDHVYLYAWKGSGASEVKILGDFPGWELNYPYEYAFPSDNYPEKIIWSIGNNTKQTANLDFVDNAVYNDNGLKKHTVAVNATYGWASVYLDYAVMVPADVTAYTASSSTNDYVTLAETESIIPANTGFVINTDLTSCDFIASVSQPAAITPNILTGVTAATSVAKNTVYVLSDASRPDNCVFSLYTNSSGENVTLGANKAYILDSNVPSHAPMIRFIVEGEENATNIENLNANENAVKFFENGQLLIMREGVVYDAVGRIIR